SLSTQPDLRRFLIAYFFYNMGVQTVMYLSALFGTDVLQLKDKQLIPTVLLIQRVGALGAFLFAELPPARGNKAAVLAMIYICIGICVAAYLVQHEYHLYAFAGVVGMAMGGLDSLSRATYSSVAPQRTRSDAPYIGLYDVTCTASTVCGRFSCASTA